MMKFEELTELEQTAMKTVEGTGWIYFDCCDGISNKQMRGVVSSLIKKGIIDHDCCDEEFECTPTTKYECWFDGLYA